MGKASANILNFRIFRFGCRQVLALSRGTTFAENISREPRYLAAEMTPQGIQAEKRKGVGEVVRTGL